MQLFNILKKVTVLLSRMYLVSAICLITWAVLPIIFGWTPTVVISGSMLPNVQIGDVIIAQNLNPVQKEAMISVGNVLLATDPLKADRLVTHRVVNVIKGTGFITKGDANATADATMVPLSNVHGIERLRIPLIGIPIEASRKGDFLPLIVFTVLTVFAQFVVFHDRKTLKQATSTKTLPLSSNANKVEKGKPRVRTSKRKSLFRLSNVTIISAFVLALSITITSSAAAFSGASANSGHSFQTVSDFTAAYKNRIIADSPFAYYRLNEVSGKSVTDSSGNGAGAKYSNMGVTLQATTALTRDTADKSVTLNGSQGSLAGSTATAGPQALTLQIWFKTTTASGGKLIGFNAGTATSTTADRVLYMTNAGKVAFGIDTATAKTIQTPLSYNDGKWHMAAATLSGLNASLYIDGTLVSSGTTSSAPTTASGFWVAGGVTFTGWLNQPTSSFFAGSIDEIAIYTKTLTSNQIAADYGAA